MIRYNVKPPKRSLTSQINIPQVERMVDRAVGDLIGRLRHYPAQRSPKAGRKRYVRTGNLKARWSQTKRLTSVEVSNNASRNGKPYAVYVQGSPTGGGPGRRQAYMHRGHWPNIKDEAKNVMRIYRPLIRRALVGRL